MLSKILRKYLRFWAKLYLKRAKPKIIAITGSVGKTSTKNAIFEVIKAKFEKKVRKSEGNLNNETGLPLAIVGFNRAPSYSHGSWLWLPIVFYVPFRAIFNSKVEYLVLEMAADKPGDISYLTEIAKPQIAIVTNIGESHLEAFGSREKLIEEKAQIFQALSSDGLAIFNLNDEVLAEKSNEGDFRSKSYAIEKTADVTAKNIMTGIENYKPFAQMQIIAGDTKFLAKVNTLGKVANVYPVLAAVAVAAELKIEQSKILEGLQNIRPENHRMNVVRGKNGAIIIDDCYNASPLSMKAALDVLKVLPSKRKIAVLGDMRELGKISKDAHRLIGEYAHAISDELLATGKTAKDYQADKFFESKQELIDYLLSQARVGDIILIKASRAIGLDKIVDDLKEGN